MNVFLITSLYTTLMSAFESMLKSKHSKKIFLFLLMLPIFIISWRRGNTTVDYGNYEYIFNSSINLPLLGGWKSINIEPGYFILNKVVSLFSTKFTSFLFVYSAIVLGIYYYAIYKFSNFYGLSVMLLIAFGSYYTSFNTMRQFLAATICILAIVNIEKGFWKYLLIVSIAASFHFSALIMIPFYFILKLRLNTIKGLTVFVMLLGLSFVLIVYTPTLVRFLTSSIYSNYSDINAFGINTGVPLSAIARIVFLIVYYLFFIKMINFDNILENISFNSIFITLIFMIFSTRVEMFQRFTYFFLPYMVILAPNVTSKINDKTTRIFFYSILFLSCLFYIFSTQSHIPFIWA